MNVGDNRAPRRMMVIKIGILPFFKTIRPRIAEMNPGDAKLSVWVAGDNYSSKESDKRNPAPTAAS